MLSTRKTSTIHNFLVGCIWLLASPISTGWNMIVGRKLHIGWWNSLFFYSNSYGFCVDIGWGHNHPWPHGMGPYWDHNASCAGVPIIWVAIKKLVVIELDDGKIYRKTLYLMVKTMVSCRFSLKPIQWGWCFGTWLLYTFIFHIAMTDPWCCYIWCSMDPINISPLC
jgi:hypothetical protein